MSYQLLIEKDRPAYYRTFDSATNQSHPIVAGLGSSAVVTTTPFEHTFDQWGKKPFSVEVWFKPLTESRTIILGHDNDGLVYENGVVKVVGVDNQGATYEASLPASSKTMYAVFSYTGYSIDLLLDGEQVSAEMLNSMTFTGNLRTAGRLSIDALAIYEYVLTQEQMEAHYYAGINFPSNEVLYENAVNYFELVDGRSQIALERTMPEWDQGYFESTLVEDGVLTLEAGQEQGYWYTSLVLADDIAFQGSKISWQASGQAPIVESSINGGTTWQRCQNNSAIVGVPVGSTLPDTDPIIRFTLFPGTSILEAKLVVYRSNLHEGFKDTNYLRLTRPAVPGESLVPVEQNDIAGAYLNGSSIDVIPTDQSNSVAAVSLWYKGAEVAGGVKNGTLGHKNDQWNFYVRNFTGTDASIPVVTNYSGQIANVALWSESQDATILYAKHFAYQTLSVSADDRIELFEPVDDVLMYQNNWIVL